MKYILKIQTFPVLTVMLLLINACGNQTHDRGQVRIAAGDSTGVADIIFNKLVHDFGTVSEGEKVASVFTFTNTGNSSLLITSAAASCGCTVPQYSRKPVPPGGKGTLEVIFNTSGYRGIQTKTITVHTNALTPVVVLTIRADIVNN